ncbi:MAG: DNA mismatch repair protein MutL, partial [Rhodothermales bacterium]|nr:DNA mismatch repair protein MutL [Rhodothermales bacterium]
MPDRETADGVGQIIRVLPDVLANKIAAGEVVERPASAVKELVENSVDAGASKIGVYLSGSGTDLIKIVDDGCGMSPVDAELAFKRHATSKIKSIEDLERVRT